MKFETKRLLYAAFPPILFIIILWLIKTLEWGYNADWYQLGIYPRNISGLTGILTEPLVHANIKHLISNTFPLLILGWCLFYFYKDLAYAVFPLIWIISGMITWIIGRESWHIGASGLIYGLSFFLFFSGILRRYIPLMAISMLVAFLYGSTVWNMLPISELVDANTSWEGHLSGAISGLILAIVFRKNGPQKPKDFEEEEEEDNEDENNEENKYWEFNDTLGKQS